MPLVPAVCTQCGAPIEVDNAKEAGICPHCGTAFITEKGHQQLYHAARFQHFRQSDHRQKYLRAVKRQRMRKNTSPAVSPSSAWGNTAMRKTALRRWSKRLPGTSKTISCCLRAQTRDFRAYYLTDSPEFDRIEKLAQTADMAAIQEKYGFSFRRDKEYRLRAYREAATLKRPQNGDLRKRFSDVGLYIDADAAAERAVSGPCVRTAPSPTKSAPPSSKNISTTSPTPPRAC